MNPLSLLFRAVDSVVRAFLALRALPWRDLARTGLARLTDPQRWRAALTRIRRWWDSVLARITDRQWWGSVLARVRDRRWWRSVAVQARAPEHRRALRITAAVLGGAVIAATASTAAALHSGDGTPRYSAAAEQRSDVRDRARADRDHDRPVPGPAASTPTAKQPAAKQPAAKKPAAKKPAAKPKRPQRNAKKHAARPRYVASWSTWRLPVHAKHYWVSSTFGRRWGVLHAGVDLAVPTGTPIRAAHSGRVSIAGPYSGYGRAVGIENGHGLATVYGHTSRVIVHRGQWVRPGQVVAFSGNTGDSTGPHLHFEMRRHGVPFNPLPFLHRHGLYLLRAAGHG